MQKLKSVNFFLRKVGLYCFFGSLPELQLVGCLTSLCAVTEVNYKVSTFEGKSSFLGYSKCL